MIKTKPILSSKKLKEYWDKFNDDHDDNILYNLNDNNDVDARIIFELTDAGKLILSFNKFVYNNKGGFIRKAEKQFELKIVKKIKMEKK